MRKQDSEKAEELLTIAPGTKLTKEQSSALQEIATTLVSQVGQRRKRLLLIHDSIQNTIGLFLQAFGMKVAYEAPFAIGGFGSERFVFDIVAEAGDELDVIEVKETVSHRDLGQIRGYIDALATANVKAQVFLGTDVLNYYDLLSGALGRTVKELMDGAHMGVILTDKYFLVICENYARLIFKEMPQFLFSEEKIE